MDGIQLQMQVDQLFVRASEQFEDRNYQAGLDIISKCIEHDTTNSLLYSNRGLFYAQLGQNQLSSLDLNKAIELNHLNYLAYFNLFSLQYRSGEKEEAFDNLCCSLSSLYLLRAKKSRRELDVQRAISYADNNFEAYVLKSLMYMEDGRLSQALNYMEWACDLKPKSILCRKLRNIIAKKVDPYAPDEYIQEGEEEVRGGRLRSSYKAEEDLDGQVEQKVKEFIEVYNQLLGEEGTVTQKVPRILNEHDKTLKSKFSQLSGIYEYKLKGSKVAELAKTKVQPATKQELQGSIEANLLEENNNEHSLEQILNEEKQDKKQILEQNEDNLLDGSIQNLPEIKTHQRPQQNQEENLLQQGDTFARVSIEYDYQKVQAPEIYSPKRTMDSKLKPNKNTISSSETSSESASLYPIGIHKKIQFTIISADLKNPSNQKDFYVTGNYNSRKGQRLRTQIKKLEGQSIQWYSGNPPTPISQSKQTLTVKLYGKQYFSVNDELIGQGQVEVLRSGELKIPVYYRTKNTGYVVVRVDLI